MKKVSASTSIAVLALRFVGLLANAYVTMQMWAWLIVPLFDVRPLPFMAALALRFFVRFTTAESSYSPEAAKMDDDDRLSYYIYHSIVSPWVVLSFAYLISFFV